MSQEVHLYSCPRRDGGPTRLVVEHLYGFEVVVCVRCYGWNSVSGGVSASLIVLPVRRAGPPRSLLRSRPRYRISRGEVRAAQYAAGGAQVLELADARSHRGSNVVVGRHAVAGELVVAERSPSNQS